MKTIIIAGGLGVRLRPLTYTIPKPLLPLGEKPILEVILSNLSFFGIRDIILSIGYCGDLIRAYFRDGSKFGVHIEYVEENEPLGTAGPLELVREKFALRQEEPLLLMNGDILTKLNFPKMIDHHFNEANELTIATRTHEMHPGFGVVKVNGNGVVQNITEKPTFSYEISAGIYVLQPSVIEIVPKGIRFDMPDLIGALITNGKKVGAYHFNEYWQSLDQLSDLEDALPYIQKWLK